eukprot:CAMPEP_0171120118 /NCGR_PEP_ID=MMETSP0766_2-20121228/98822_1 /TAXON_ID=439317 /ORGANISM="Gambierdiscus australes, Strain CAWD 149" /LENGTH=30 /DNA_ID= /DNA_START= /DNA_END= /DNA_ORIENTATION=
MRSLDTGKHFDAAVFAQGAPVPAGRLLEVP